MSATFLQRAGALAVLALVQACNVDESLGYWKATPAPGAAREEGQAPKDGGTGSDQDGSTSSAAAESSALRAGAGAAGSGGSVSAPGASSPTRAGACEIARAGTPALEVTVTDVNTMLYDFANGMQFPAGSYRVTYVDGCRKYDATGAWTLHASALAAVLAPTRRGGAFMIMSGAENLGLAPGTAGVIIGPGDEPNGAFATYEECVTANLAVAPVDFPFSGGTLGVMNAGDANTISTTRGEAVGGRSPTFRLSRLDPCP